MTTLSSGEKWYWKGGLPQSYFDLSYKTPAVMSVRLHRNMFQQMPAALIY